MNENILFLNGEFLPAEQGVISVRTHGFCYGTGCFEGIRGYWQEHGQQLYLFRAAEHFERLLRSCQILHVSLPYTAQQLVELACELARRNGQRCDVYLRTTVYKSSENILLGITRDTVMALARREFGMRTCERQVDRTELYSADEVFLCGTGAQIAPVVSVDHRRIGAGEIGPVSRQIQQRYAEIVRGTDAAYRDTWCTPVYAREALAV